MVDPQRRGYEGAAQLGEVQRIAGATPGREDKEHRLSLVLLPRLGPSPPEIRRGWREPRSRGAMHGHERHSVRLPERQRGLHRASDQERRGRELQEPGEPLHAPSLRSSRQLRGSSSRAARPWRETEHVPLPGGRRAGVAQRCQGGRGGDSETVAGPRSQRRREEPHGRDATPRSLLRAVPRMR